MILFPAGKDHRKVRHLPVGNILQWSVEFSTQVLHLFAEQSSHRLSGSLIFVFNRRPFCDTLQNRNPRGVPVLSPSGAPVPTERPYSLENV
jgi:hypothetical protein